MSSTIRITLTKQIEEFLEQLRNSKFRFMENAEIIRIILSEYCQLQTEKQQQKQEQWAASLPMMELSDEDQESLSKGIHELANLKPNEGYMTPEEIMTATDPN